MQGNVIMGYKISLSFIFMLVLTSLIVSKQYFAQTDKTYGLAVLDLQSIGISELEARALSEMLRSSIANIIVEESKKGKFQYNLLERSQMDKILEQFEIQDLGCTDLSCAVKFGKMLNVERIIIGSVSIIGSTYLVIARIVDVETSTTIASVNRKMPGVIDNVIDLMPIVSHELLTGESLPLPVSTKPLSTQPDSSDTSIMNISNTITKTEISLGIKMISIPEGSFVMGSNGEEDDENPQHKVTLSSFMIGETEITQAQYEAIIGTNPSRWKGDTLPVEQVSWYDAVKYCNLLSDKSGLDHCYDESTWKCVFNKNGFRLPTEAEWEYACRAGTITKFYTGENSSDLRIAGWFKSNSNQHTHPVGEKGQNLWGLYDMHGNVWEWCNDFYSNNYNENSPEYNPTGPNYGSFHVYRGGCCYNFSDACRSANRCDNPPGKWNDKIGFRVVRR